MSRCVGCAGAPTTRCADIRFAWPMTVINWVPLGLMGPFTARNTYLPPSHHRRPCRVSSLKTTLLLQTRMWGLDSFPDAVIAALIDNVDSLGPMDVADVVEELTDRFGGEMLDNAMCLRRANLSRRDERMAGLDPMLLVD